MPEPATIQKRRLPVLVLIAIATAAVWTTTWLADRTGSGGRTDDRRSVLIVTIDTLRADHVGCYGHSRPTTPNIDRLAADGVRFDQATTPRGKTQPSMVSLLTGLYPHEHGIRTNIGRLPSVRLALDPEGPLRPSHATPVLLAEELSATGLATAAFIGNFILTAERTGLDRGFDVYDDELTSTESGRVDVPERKARENTDRAVRWLRNHADEAFFLWVHYIDPHGTYEPPAAFDRFKSEPLGRVPLDATTRETPVDESGRRILVPPHNLVPNLETGRPEQELARYVDLYDGEIAYTDAEVGRLLATLDELERTDDTLVILTADHGESLGEHAVYFEHGYYTYDVSVRVPLIVRPPANDPRFALSDRGRVIAAPADLLDLRPTILDWLDLARTARPSGRSLVDVLAGDAGDLGRVTFTERSEFGSLMRAARTPEWKLIYNLATHVEWPLPFTRELYDLDDDPLEARNLYGSDEPRHAAARIRLEEELERWMRGTGELRSYVGEDLEAIANLPADHLEHLRAIGYVDASTLEHAARPNAAQEFRERPVPESNDPREVLMWALAGRTAMRPFALEALARYDEMPAETLVDYLSPEQPLEVRARAAELAGELGHTSAVPALQRTMAHADSADTGLFVACAYALALLSAEDSTYEALDEATRHASSGARGLAAWYLGKLARTSALEPLTRDASDVVRVFAWEALASTDRPAALLELERLTTSDRPPVVQAAALALAGLRTPDANRARVQALRRSAHPEIANVGQELAVWSSPGEALMALRAREQLSPAERRRLVNAAAIAAGLHARSELERALTDTDPDVRVIAAAHLLRLARE